MTKSKAKRAHVSSESVETKENVATAVKSEVKKTAEDGIKEIWEQLLGAGKDVKSQVVGKYESSQTSEDSHGNEHILEEGQEAVLQAEEKVEKIQAQMAHNEYFREIQGGEKQKLTVEQRELQGQIQQILVEIKRIANTSKGVKMAVKEAEKQEMPKEVGRYHLNFFDWLLGVVRDARVKMEAGAQWSGMFSSKKKQKQYWGMAKKHGTSFSLSGERSSSNQTG